MDKGRFLIETHLRTGRPIGELAAAHGVSRSWLYKLLARYRRFGPDGLEPRSRRPGSSPTRIAGRWEEPVVALRKELVDAGFDAGAQTIHTYLSRSHPDAPSVSTIWRILKTRGFVTPQPHKRPRNSWTRFVADFPNECWQADVTHWALADGTPIEILDLLDDHSRLAVALVALRHTRSVDVVRVLHKAAATWGYPASFLTDNGAIFTASRVAPHSAIAALEAELLALGITSKHSRPYHPQTCGKIERFHQTLKKYLAAQDPPTTKKQLQRQLDRFANSYNHTRPHRAINRQTPITAWTAREKAVPTGPRLNTAGYRVRHDKISTAGTITLRYRSRLHHIGIGRAYAGQRIIILAAGPDVRILTLDGHPLRHLTIDPTTNYQRQP